MFVKVSDVLWRDEPRQTTLLVRAGCECCYKGKWFVVVAKPGKCVSWGPVTQHDRDEIVNTIIADWNRQHPDEDTGPAYRERKNLAAAKANTPNPCVN